MRAAKCTAEIPLSRSYSFGTHVAVPKASSEVFFGRGKTGGITHGKIDDLQMRIGVSGQPLWAVNEGAQPDSQRQRLALHRL